MSTLSLGAYTTCAGGILVAGTRVELRGLDRTEFNGAQGIFAGMTEKEGRIRVEMEKGKHLSIKTDNVIPVLVLVPIEGKGSGIVSKCFIRAGSLLVSEAPILRVSDVSMQTQLSELPSTKQDSVWALHDYMANKDGNTLEGIFRTNATPCGGMHANGLCLLTSRFNHSCLPNACYGWDADSAVQVVKALQDISPGDEICVFYTGVKRLFLPREARRRMLLQNFHFECQCRACIDEDDESDKRRSDLFKISTMQEAILKETAQLLRYHQRDSLREFFEQGLALVDKQLAMLNGECIANRAEALCKGLQFAILCNKSPNEVTKWTQKAHSAQLVESPEFCPKRISDFFKEFAEGMGREFVAQKYFDIDFDSRC